MNPECESDQPKDELVWSEIKDEKMRTYFFPGGDEIMFANVVKLCVRPSGNHRLEDKDGRKYIVKDNWLAIAIDADQWSA